MPIIIYKHSVSTQCEIFKDWLRDLQCISWSIKFFWLNIPPTRVFLCNHPLPLNPHEPEKKSLKYLHKQALFILSYISFTVWRCGTAPFWNLWKGNSILLIVLDKSITFIMQLPCFVEYMYLVLTAFAHIFVSAI